MDLSASWHCKSPESLQSFSNGTITTKPSKYITRLKTEKISKFLDGQRGVVLQEATHRHPAVLPCTISVLLENATKYILRPSCLEQPPGVQVQLNYEANTSAGRLHADYRKTHLSVIWRDAYGGIQEETFLSLLVVW